MFMAFAWFGVVIDLYAVFCVCLHWVGVLFLTMYFLSGLLVVSGFVFPVLWSFFAGVFRENGCLVLYAGQ